MTVSAFETLEAQPPTFAIPVGGLARWDVGFSLMSQQRGSSQERVRLGELLTEARYGTSSRAVVDVVGVPVLRMGNIQDHGWNLHDLKYIEFEPSELVRFLMRPGDVLVNRTNTEELVGKAAAWRGDGDWAFASYLIRLRVDKDRLDSDFLAAWLNSVDARKQIDRVSRRSAGQTNISATDLKALEIPVLPLPTQRALAGQLERAHLERDTRLASVRADLSRVVLDLAQALGLDHGGVAAPLSQVTQVSELSTSYRFDVSYYHPDRKTAARAVELDSHARVGALCEIVRQKVRGTSDAFGLGAIESGTGRLASEWSLEPMNEALTFSPNEILLARLRPALNKVWLADRSGYCSPEFVVLRVIEGVSPGYVAAALRCWFMLDQLKWASTGNTHPRLPDNDLLNALIPRRSPEIENNLSEKVDKALAAALRREEQAKRDWSDAKAEFDRVIGA